ncbi:MAG: hypothetical protein Q4G11_06000 [Gallicola sp.]|nr:hypothetical protein [Gallicola sp.]
MEEKRKGAKKATTKRKTAITRKGKVVTNNTQIGSISAAEKRRDFFLKALKASMGVIAPALEQTQITRRTYTGWMNDFADFRHAVDEIMESRIDFVESKLLQNIQANDNTAIIFYLKTMAKQRGYNERLEVTGANGKALMPEKIQIEVIDTIEQVREKDEEK